MKLTRMWNAIFGKIRGLLPYSNQIIPSLSYSSTLMRELSIAETEFTVSVISPAAKDPAPQSLAEFLVGPSWAF